LNMNSYNQQRPSVSQVPAKYQMEFAAYLQSRQSDWGTAEQWLARRMANSGNAVKMQTLSPGTTRHDPQRAPVVEREIVHAAPPAPVSTVSLGHRHVGDGGFPRHGEPLPDEVLHPVTGEPVTKSETRREDY
jgi:hypothetical protein